MIKYEIQKSDLEFFEKFRKNYPKSDVEAAKNIL